MPISDPVPDDAASTVVIDGIVVDTTLRFVEGTVTACKHFDESAALVVLSVDGRAERFFLVDDCLANMLGQRIICAVTHIGEAPLILDFYLPGTDAVSPAAEIQDTWAESLDLVLSER